MATLFVTDQMMPGSILLLSLSLITLLALGVEALNKS